MYIKTKPIESNLINIFFFLFKHIFKTHLLNFIYTYQRYSYKHIKNT